MNVLVDTSVWSLALRRSRPSSRGDARLVEELTELIQEGRALLIGPIRQELLSGISDVRQFNTLRDRMRAFNDLGIHEVDYERAAEFSNRCRVSGLQGSHTDFLICSVAAGKGAAILSTDKDFTRYAKHLPIALHAVRARGKGSHR
jgi:predicted nucleic acid-binding protein